METIAHVLSPFMNCPFNCPFCCARGNSTNNNIELTKDYWTNLVDSIENSYYENIMITGDTEPTLFPEWIKKVVDITNDYDLISELRTHNYIYNPTDVYFDQVWYSITEAKDLQRLSDLYAHGRNFADEVNFALLINKDFKIEDIIRARISVPESKFTIRYLIDTCGSDAVSQWVQFNRIVFNHNIERLLELYRIRIKRDYESEYDIIRQDGIVYHEWQ